jgi:NAD(P)-dependent dehydrogenase (short-subunit alcohol dehydrogenase family)
VKSAIVIGASQGLGKYLATRLAEQGWEVTGIGRRSLEDVGNALSFEYIQADLSDVATLDLLSRLFGEKKPDLIVHNAVTYGELRRPGPTLNELETIFRVNTLLPYRLLLEYLSTVPQDMFTSCIVVNSDSIYHANQHSGVYAASKAALRILTTALADFCQSRNASVSTLLLGPLEDQKKVDEFRRIAERKGVSKDEIMRLFLRKSNPSLVIDSLIEFEPCFQSIQYIASLGRVANGMLCKLDGGSSGSLV